MRKMITAILTSAFTAVITLCSANVHADLIVDDSLVRAPGKNPAVFIAVLLAFSVPVGAVFLLMKKFNKKK